MQLVCLKWLQGAAEIEEVAAVGDVPLLLVRRPEGPERSEEMETPIIRYLVVAIGSR